MLYRKNIIDLENWKENENTALLVEGARQVGKTKLIEKFIKTFNNYIEIDFAKNADALDILLETKNYDDFLNRLSLLSPITLKDKNDILFLDEIQYYYEIREKRIEEDSRFKERHVDIITLSKDIASRGGFRLIMSGSLLGVAIMNINLNPTGYLKKLTMYPLDFEEFLLANGIKQSIINDVKESFINKETVSESINTLFLNKFREYVLIGGFPESVQGYVDDKTLEKTTSALEIIDNWYRSDITKYAKKEDRLVILEMYNHLPYEVNQKNHKFVKSHLTSLPNFKNLDLQDQFLWLKGAGIAIPTYNVSNPRYPITISEDYKVVKLYMNDVGLLTYYIFNRAAKRRLLIDAKGYDLGAIYENAVAELLLSHGYDPRFHSTVKRGEIDFIIENNMTVIPIEIKSCEPERKSGFFSHPALNHLLEHHKEIKEAWVFGLNNVKKENDTIQMFPIYMIDFVRNIK